MTRQKVKLNWIVSDSARKASFKKRKAGLLKKVSELTTLCDINACVIIYNPEDREMQMWPSRPLVEQMLNRFNGMSEMEKCKKMVNQETYLTERVGKLQDQLKKHDRKNKEMDVKRLMEELYRGKTIDEFNAHELQGLIWLMEENKREIRKRVEFHQQVNPAPVEPLHRPPPSSLPQLPTSADSTVPVGVNTGGAARNPAEPAQWEQWYIDMMKNSDSVAGSSSARAKSDARLTGHQALAASSSAANQIWLSPGNPRDYNLGTDMRVPQGNINIGSSSRLRDSDVNLDLLQGNTGNASHARDTGLQPEPFGGSIAESDAGVPYDVTKHWPQNFYP